MVQLRTSYAFLFSMENWPSYPLPQSDFLETDARTSEVLTVGDRPIPPAPGATFKCIDDKPGGIISTAWV